MTFLSLYQGQTLDSSHGDAIGAALKYLVNNATQHVPSGGNYWNYNLTYRLTTSVVSKYGLMHGMAGIGLSLLKTNVRARDGVTTAASLATQTEALRISTNPVRYTGGYYGLGQGVAGVGLGYIEQYRLTSDSTYFTRAQACADTLKNPIYWRESSTSTANISGLDKGLAGIGLFQLRMFQTSGDSSYLDTSITIANALVARQTGGRWPYSLTDSTYYTNYADGAAGIIYFLIELYKMTQSVTYLNSIEAGL
jgi:lantibiotic modifying enzyme